MAIYVQGVMKAVSASAAFMMTSSMAAPEPQSAPVTAAAPTPSATSPASLPPDPVATVVGDLQKDFRYRVATGKATPFNTCFTSARGGISAQAVDSIRNGNAGMIRLVWQKSETDYSQPPLVVLDRGHGHEAPGLPYGYETGAIRGDVIEAQVVDAISEKVRETLEQIGATVIETRGSVDDGVGLSQKYKFRDQDRALQWRSELSYRLAMKFPERPVIFLSLHANTAGGPRPVGAEVFYYDGAGAQSSSAEFARSIAAHYKTPAGRSSIKSADFGVLRCQHQKTPAVMLELGFLTNPHDRLFLRSAMKDENKAQDIADMVVAGIEDYVERKQREQNPRRTMLVASNEPSMKIQ